MTTTTKHNPSTNHSSNWSSLVGNLIAQEGAGGELTTDGDYYREYNALHQLTKIRKKTSTGKIIEEYSYGPDGERIMTVNYLTNTTIYTPFREWMMIVNRTGSYNYTYVYDGNTLVAKINPDGTKWFYHDDHLGSTSLITDQDGNIVEETFYNPFGQVTSGGEREAYLLYTNQMKDAIGCYDYGARVYCPKWYHFTKADPITANVFEPQKLNHYSYVINNPYVYIDPTGKKVKSYGANKGYGSGSAYANAVNAARNGGSSSGSYYSVTYQIDQDQERTVYIDADSFEEIQQRAKEYADKSVYAWFSDLTRNVEEEQIVAYMEALQGREYDPRNGLQKVVQNGWVQAGGSVVIGTAAGVIGTPLGGVFLGGGVAGIFETNDLIEKEAKGEDISYGDITWAYVGTGAGALGGKATSVTTSIYAEQLGIEVSEHVVIDAAYEIGGEAAYNQYKNAVINDNDGGENNG